MSHRSPTRLLSTSRKTSSSPAAKKAAVKAKPGSSPSQALAAAASASSGVAPRVASQTVFDQLSMGFLTFLKSHYAVQDVSFIGQDPASASQLQRWEDTNAPLMLPEDLKSFFRMYNGVDVTWTAALGARSVPLGDLHVNSVRDLRPVPIERSDLCWPPGLSEIDVVSTRNSRKDTTTAWSPASKSRTSSRFPVAFDLDTRCHAGNVLLVFHSRLSTPRVWFQDLTSRCHYLADSFSAYFRLSVVHLGIASWPTMFSSVGPDPITRQWLRFFCPERVRLDELEEQAPPVAQLPLDTALGDDDSEPLNLLEIDRYAAVARKAKRKNAESSSSGSSRAKTPAENRINRSRSSSLSRPKTKKKKKKKPPQPKQSAPRPQSAASFARPRPSTAAQRRRTAAEHSSSSSSSTSRWARSSSRTLPKSFSSTYASGSSRVQNRPSTATSKRTFITKRRSFG